MDDIIFICFSRVISRNRMRNEKRCPPQSYARRRRIPGADATLVAAAH